MSSITAKSSITNSEIVNSPSPVKWYSEDEVNNWIISEYQKFKDSLNSEIKRQFDKNFNLAKKACEQSYYTLANDVKIVCNKIHLRYTSIDTFDAIFVLPEKIFLSDKFDLAYEIVSDIANDYAAKNISLIFHFMPSAKNVNNKALFSDGFKLTFKK